MTCPRITSGAIRKIFDREEISEPIVQVLDIEKLGESQENPSSRFELIISDGLYHLRVMLARHFNSQVQTGQFSNNPIIKLTKFCYVFGNDGGAVILEMEVINLTSNGIIGNPIPIRQLKQRHKQPQQRNPNQQQRHHHHQKRQLQSTSLKKIGLKVYNGSQIRRFQLPISTGLLELKKQMFNITEKNSNSQISIFYRDMEGSWHSIHYEQEWIKAKNQYISRNDKKPLLLKCEWSHNTEHVVLNEPQPSKQRVLEPPQILRLRGRRLTLRGNFGNVRHPFRFPPVFKQSRYYSKKIVDVSSVADSYSNTLTFYINGEKHMLNDVSPEVKLVEYLRSIGLTGTKIGCGEGGCGACTVVVASSHTQKGESNVSSRSINGCLCPLVTLDGMYVTTTEGIGSQHAGFHAIQQQLADCNGSQCGYCSPGFVMSMYGLLQKSTTPPSSQTIEDRFDGNICRCTGYRPILKAMHTFGEKNNPIPSNPNLKDVPQTFSRLLPSLERPKRFASSDGSSVWYSPTTLSDVYQLLKTHSDDPLRLTVGNTSMGVVKYYPFHVNDDPRVYIDLTRIPDLVKIATESDGMEFGAAVTLATMIDALAANGNRNYIPLVRHMKFVANHLVRNVASWAGNIMIAKTHPDFPSDLVTIFSGVGATVYCSNGKHTNSYSIPDFLNQTMDSTFILTSIKIPLASPTQYFDSWKVAERQQNSHALVNAGFSFTYGQKDITIEDATLVYGNITRGPLVCTKTASALKGRSLTQQTLNVVMSVLEKEIIPVDPTDPDPTWVVVDKDYRKSLALSLFFKFFLGQIAQFGTLPERVVSATIHYERPISKGTQYFTPDKKESPISYPIPKLSAKRQASGEAIYTNDIPTTQHTVHASYVQSTKAKATIISIDASQALAMDGVIDFISAKTVKDIGGVNECGLIPGDEEVFASTEVKSVGQPIGLIVANTQAIANRAAKKVHVQYKDSTDPPLLTLQDAIEKKAFMKPIPNVTAPTDPIVKGDIDAGFAASDHILEGEFTSGSQIHFYMETQSAVVTPEENAVFRCQVSTQDLQGAQGVLASVLNIKQNKLVMETTRCGGAYGGKISRQTMPLCAVGVAAAALRRPVSMQLTRNIDMNMTGGRLDKIYKFKIGYMNDGSIKSYHIIFYGNGGWSYDGSFACLQMAMYWSDNVYCIPNVKVESQCCFQNRVTTTSVRAPGVLSSTYSMELMLETVASSLKMTPTKVREINFYKNGDKTITGDTIVNITLPRIWTKIHADSDFDKRLANVKKFNESNRWRKRGIRISPVKYGANPGAYIESVILNVNMDGTISVTQTGIEIGQGLITKVVQTIAYSLGIPMDMIEVYKCSTEKIARTSVTGGSGTSEACCGAALDACSKLNALLAPLKKAHPTAKWEDLIGMAYMASYNMTILGYWAPGSALPFDYYVYGAACSEVEVDVLTGELEILRVDIVYDCGQSLNPAIDIGQVEGGFMTGVGFYFTEDVLYNTTTGRLISNGTWEYKPPCSKSIPLEFNVTFLDNARNERKNAVLGSKLCGEPPCILSHSTYFATVDAIQAARVDAGHPMETLFLNAPLTREKIQKACLVDPNQFLINPNKIIY